MEALQQRILADGRNLGRGILKVDSFVNHQVDPMLMHDCAQEFARRFEADRPTKVLTAEISGIAPALLTALELKRAAWCMRASTSPSPCRTRCF